MNLPAPASANAKDDEKKAERRQRARTDITIILQSVDQEHQQGRGNELGEKLPGLRHERRRIRAEDAGCCILGVSWNRPNARPSLVNVNGGFVICVNDAGSTHGAKDLSQSVHWELLPRKLAEHAVGEGNCWVYVGTTDTGSVDTEHNTKALDNVSEVSTDLALSGLTQPQEID